MFQLSFVVAFYGLNEFPDLLFIFHICYRPFLSLEQFGKEKDFVFCHQALDIQINKIRRFFLRKTELLEIQNAVFGMTFITGDTDFFFMDVPVKVL